MLRIIFSAVFCCMASHALSADSGLFKGGHIKYRFQLLSLPGDSVYRDIVDTPVIDHYADLRLKFDWQQENIHVVTDYQLVAGHGDSLELADQLAKDLLSPSLVPSDTHRLMNLTHVVSQGGDSLLAHRLDRLYIDITDSNLVLRVGRQTVSWGNGLLYSPMDFFNPFDPALVDKEYKTGDDMLYGQYLRQNGDDLQGVWVVRRDDNGKVTGKVDSIAAKYHGFGPENEYDLLVARHFDDNILAIGGAATVGGAVWRADVMLTDTQTDEVLSLVTNLSYSWSGWGHNISGVLEYFYNGFGIGDGDYSPAALGHKPDLVRRVLRGELFTLARHYLAGSAMVEVTPLWQLTTNLFVNLADESMLGQLVSSYNLKQDWQLQAAVSLPVGKAGSEFGGIDSAIKGRQYSYGPSLFAQLAWYF